MISDPIRAVAIDDEPSHLLGITTGLTAIGIPCMGFWYDRSLNELRPDPPQSGLPFVRLVFMDLNLAERVSCALGFSWTLDCERVLAGGVSR